MKAVLMELQRGSGWPPSSTNPMFFLTEQGSQDVHGGAYTHFLASARDLSCLLWHPVIDGMTNSYQWVCECITEGQGLRKATDDQVTFSVVW